MAKKPKDPVYEAMLRAGRGYLSANLKATPDDYKVKQVMALAAPTHTAQHQLQALNALKQEFRKR
jgi:hypothetical protein